MQNAESTDLISGFDFLLKLLSLTDMYLLLISKYGWLRQHLSRSMIQKHWKKYG